MKGFIYRLEHSTNWNKFFVNKMIDQVHTINNIKFKEYVSAVIELVHPFNIIFSSRIYNITIVFVYI